MQRRVPRPAVFRSPSGPSPSPLFLSPSLSWSRFPSGTGHFGPLPVGARELASRWTMLCSPSFQQQSLHVHGGRGPSPGGAPVTVKFAILPATVSWVRLCHFYRRGDQGSRHEGSRPKSYTVQVAEPGCELGSVCLGSLCSFYPTFRLSLSLGSRASGCFRVSRERVQNAGSPGPITAALQSPSWGVGLGTCTLKTLCRPS